MRLVSNHRHHGDPQNDLSICPGCGVDCHEEDFDRQQFDHHLGEIVCFPCFRDYERREARDSQAKTD
jgi:hypothetical protein